MGHASKSKTFGESIEGRLVTKEAFEHCHLIRLAATKLQNTDTKSPPCIGVPRIVREDSVINILSKSSAAKYGSGAFRVHQLEMSDSPEIAIISHVVSAHKMAKGDVPMPILAGLCEVHSLDIFSYVVPELCKLEGCDIARACWVVYFHVEYGYRPIADLSAHGERYPRYAVRTSGEDSRGRGLDTWC